MRKLFTLAAVLLLAIAATAQDERTCVCVDKFRNNSGMSDITVNNLRNEIMQGILDKKRLTVVDITAIPNMPSDMAGKLAVLRERNIEYLVEGTMNSIITKPSSDTKLYTAEINYTLTIVDPATGVTKSTDTYKDSWSIGSSGDEAILKAIENAKKRMATFVDEKFKVEAIIKALDQIDEKKGAVKTCYISVGSNAGIQKGQIFEVLIMAEVAGEQIEKKIAEVKAKEVMSGTLTLCEVKSGGQEIKKNFDEKVTMIVLSRASKNLFNTSKSLIGL